VRWNLRQPAIEWQQAGEATWTALPVPSPWPVNEMYVQELIAFASYVRGDGPNGSPIADSIRALGTVAAARAAAASEAPAC
jgi:hypothetical protein